MNKKEIKNQLQKIVRSQFVPHLYSNAVMDAIRTEIKRIEKQDGGAWFSVDVTTSQDSPLELKVSIKVLPSKRFRKRRATVGHQKSESSYP